MRVLDLDMDFFLTGVCELAKKGERPSLREARPWAEADVRAFLEENCGFRGKGPSPAVSLRRTTGRCFSGRNGWRRASCKRRSTSPTWTRIPTSALASPAPPTCWKRCWPCPRRRAATFPRYVREEKLDEANYLLFALALRYVSSLENVRNPIRARISPPASPRTAVSRPTPSACPPRLPACCRSTTLPSRPSPIRPTTTFVLSAPPPPATLPASPSPRATRPGRRTSSPTCFGSISQRYRG